MQGLLENLPVVAMLLITESWVVVQIIAVPVILGLIALTRRMPWHRPHGVLITAAAVVGGGIAALLAFLLTSSQPADLRYWVDWTFLAGIVVGGALYGVLVCWVGAVAFRRREPDRSLFRT